MFKPATIRSQAYTLIEILVSLTIIGILFGFGYVSFRDFARRQSIVGAAKVLQGDLRLAQQQALSGQKPDSGCATLDGIRFSVSGSSYSFSYICNAIPISPELKSVVLPSDLSIASTISPVQFNILGNGTNIPAGSSAVVTLTQTGTGNTAQVTINAGGEIK